MITIKYPKREQWASIIERPHLDVSQLTATVKTVLDDVKALPGVLYGEPSLIRVEK